MKYTFSYSNPHKHFVDIEFIIDHITAEAIEIQLPAWRPGRYELGNFAKNIQQWKAYGTDNSVLKFKRLKIIMKKDTLMVRIIRFLNLKS